MKTPPTPRSSTEEHRLNRPKVAQGTGDHEGTQTGIASPPAGDRANPAGSIPAGGTTSSDRVPRPLNFEFFTPPWRGKGAPLHQKWSINLGEEHLCESGVYLRRWRIETPLFSIRLHHWMHSDDDRSMHDHPWNFYTLILRGSYLDESAEGSQRCAAGHVYYRPATHAHWVHLDRGECWTVIFTGPKVRRWGFWVNGLWRISFKYFYEFGSHPCE